MSYLKSRDSGMLECYFNQPFRIGPSQATLRGEIKHYGGHDERPIER